MNVPITAMRVQTVSAGNTATQIRLICDFISRIRSVME